MKFRTYSIEQDNNVSLLSSTYLDAMITDAVDGLIIELDAIANMNKTIVEVDLGDGKGSAIKSAAKRMESIKSGTDLQKKVIRKKHSHPISARPILRNTLEMFKKKYQP